MKKSKYTQEDLTTKEAIWVVIYDEQRRILIQDHVKLNFFTIPIWKVREWENIENVMKNEVLTETNLRVLESRIIWETEWEYDYDWVKKRIKTLIFEVLTYEWNLENKEPTKHRSCKFMDLQEIMQLSKISDATRYFLSTIGLWDIR